jgi:hypothetical protein
MDDATWRRSTPQQRYDWLYPRPVPPPVEVVIPVAATDPSFDWAAHERNTRKAQALAEIERETARRAEAARQQKVEEHHRWRASNALAQLTGA